MYNTKEVLATTKDKEIMMKNIVEINSILDKYPSYGEDKDFATAISRAKTFAGLAQTWIGNLDTE